MTKQASRFMANPDCSKILVIANVLIFLALVFSSGWRSYFFPSSDALLHWGANLGAISINGQYWRFFTSMFIHAGILHLALNMYGLWTFGPMVLNYYGTIRFLIIYFLSGLAGSLASTVWNPTQISAGASGALVGLAGSMLAVMIAGKAEERKKYAHPLIFFAVICASLLYGFFEKGIDNAAHIGGLFCGLLCGLLLQQSDANQNKLRLVLSRCGLLSLIISAFVSGICMAKSDLRSYAYKVAGSARESLREKKYSEAYAGYDRLLKSELNSSYFVGRAAALAGMKKYHEAINDCERAIALNPSDLNAYMLRAKIHHDLHEPDLCLKDLGTVIAKNPRHAAAYNSRSWTLISIGRYKEALHDADLALGNDPSMAEALDTRALALYFLKKYERAIADLKMAIELKPDDGAAHFHLALIYCAQSRRKDARMELAEAGRLGYEAESWEPQATCCN